MTFFQFKKGLKETEKRSLQISDITEVSCCEISVMLGDAECAVLRADDKLNKKQLLLALHYHKIIKSILRHQVNKLK